MKKIRLTAVSYLNTKPLLYGLVKSDIAKEIDLQLDIPSICGEKLVRGDVDLGLIPVAVIPELSNPHIISEYCIGTVGPVKTVGIFAEHPIEELTHIYLDYHSRTSVELARVLIEDHWKLSPQLVPAKVGFETEIRGKTGGLVIGDRAISMQDKFPFFYDLGEIWMKHTGLPFVFAAWVSNRPLDKDFVQRFNQAIKEGLDEIPQLIYLLPSPASGFDLKEYFTRYISYELDPPKRKALSRFLSRISDKVQPSLEQSLAVAGY